MKTETYITAALEAFGLSREELMGRSKKSRFCDPRAVLMWRMLKRPNLSLPAVGLIMDRDHTTVLAARRKVDAKLAAGDEAFISLVAGLEAMIIRASALLDDTIESMKPPENLPSALAPRKSERAICFSLSRKITPRVYIDRYGADR